MALLLGNWHPHLNLDTAELCTPLPKHEFFNFIKSTRCMDSLIETEYIDKTQSLLNYTEETLQPLKDQVDGQNIAQIKCTGGQSWNWIKLGAAQAPCTCATTSSLPETPKSYSRSGIADWQAIQTSPLKFCCFRTPQSWMSRMLKGEERLLDYVLKSEPLCHLTIYAVKSNKLRLVRLSVLTCICFRKWLIMR